jgi:hypothetical protein
MFILEIVVTKVLIWLNTYQRNKLFERLLNNIEESRGRVSVDMIVCHDGFCEDCEELKREKLIKIFYQHNRHCGKEGYWKLINVGLSLIQPIYKDYDICIKMDDDMCLCENFFDLITTYWSFLQTKTKRLFSLDILSVPKQRGKTLSGEKVSSLPINKTLSVYPTNWVDMNFIFNPKALEEIDFKINNCSSNARSSGVGLWLTRKFESLSYAMWQTDRSLLIHGDHPSQMHKGLRKENPIITKGLK